MRRRAGTIIIITIDDDLLQGFAPSHGRLEVTHWSQACLEVVALDAAAVPLRREGAVVVGGFSEAWHLLMCRERRSLAWGIGVVSTGKKEGMERRD